MSLEHRTTKPKQKLVRVRRVLVYEGAESWVRTTLEQSFITEAPFICAKGKIEQIVCEEMGTGGKPFDYERPLVQTKAAYEEPKG